MTRVRRTARPPDRPEAREALVRGGLPGVVLEHSAGGVVEIALHGAHVLSWTRLDGDEMLFLGRRAILDGERAIRGGVPVIFPQFGPGPLPKHGFARTTRWTLAALRTNDGHAAARLELRDDERTRAVWPNAFRLELLVALDDCLTMRLTADTVVWNPWTDGAASIADLAADEWREMLCVEAAAAGEPVRLAPGSTWRGMQRRCALPPAP